MQAHIGQIHREKILALLRAGGRMLSWGPRADTLAWFADRLPPGATLTVVEQNDSVRAAAGQRFDLILVNGTAGPARMDAARDLLTPGGTVCLHDGHRPQYDEVKQAFRCWGVVGACPEDGVSHLWFGGLESPRAAAGTHAQAPLIVSYFTEGTAYEDEARNLIASCERLGLAYDVAPMPNLDSWDANVAQKTEVCLRAWQRHGRPILWVDADATVLAYPALLACCAADVAFHRWDDWQMCGGTLFFNQTPLAERLLTRWVERCRQEPHVLDQVSLDLAWEEITARLPVHTLWLPRAYCHIFDASPDVDQATVIVHGQASRRLKKVVSRKPPRPMAQPSEAIQRARKASRPRRWLLSRPDTPAFDTEVTEERALDTVLPGGRPLGPRAAPPGARAEGWWIHADDPAPSETPGERAGPDAPALRDAAADITALEACLREVEIELDRCRDAILEERLADVIGALRARQPSPFAIYGAGLVGRTLCRMAERAGLTPVAFVETDPARHGDMVCGISIIASAEVRAAACHLYVIGSFASGAAMIAALDEAYRGTPLAYDILMPRGPSPRLPDVSRATSTLRAVHARVRDARPIAEAQA